LRKVNLAETFVEALVYPQRNKSLVRHWLPAEFCINTIEFRRDHVVPYFSRSANICGFALRVKGWEGQRNTLHLCCARGKEYKPRPNKEKEQSEEDKRELGTGKIKPNPKASPLKKKRKTPPRVDTTTKPLKGEDRCPFFFNVYWDKDEKRWWIPEKQNGNPNHVGHLQVTQDIVPARASNLPLGDRILASDMIKGNFGLSAMHMLLLKRNGISLSMKKLEYLRSKEREVVENPNLSRSFGDNPMVNPKTPADKLLEQFDSDEN
jgi:hypothetical protein